MTRLLFSTAAWLLLGAAVCCPGQETALDQPLEHLVLAAAHLEQAGLTEQAAEVRLLIQAADAGDRQCLLERKLAALAGLQAEIAQLRQTEAASPQVLIRLQLLSLQREKIHALGLSFAQLLDQPGMPPLVDDSGTLAAFLDTLRQQGLVQVWAEPTILAAVGRDAVFVSGGLLARDSAKQTAAATDPDSPDFYGTYVKCRPQLNGPTIGLDLTFRCAQLVRDDGRCWATSRSAAGETGRAVTEVTTSLQVPTGQQIILAGQRLGRAGGDSALILVVKAERVQDLEQHSPTPILRE